MSTSARERTAITVAAVGLGVIGGYLLAKLQKPELKPAASAPLSSQPLEQKVLIPANDLVPASPKAPVSFYETDQSLNEYLLMHYGTREIMLPYKDQCAATALEFPKRCAQLCIKLAQDDPRLGKTARVLDLGCAVGRASFELARYFESVVGIDYSRQFVGAADKLKQNGEMKYEYVVEGDLRRGSTAQVDPAIERARCEFMVGDACDLDLKRIGKFDVVMGANLLCRLPKPRAFLQACSELVVPEGLLVLISPYTWMEQYTPKSEWMGGYTDPNGRPVPAFEGMQLALQKDFQLVSQDEMPFFIKETYRKNQYTVSHVTVWRRRRNA